MNTTSRHVARRTDRRSRARLVILGVAALMLLNQVIVAGASDLSINNGVISSTVKDGGPSLRGVLAADDFSTAGTLTSAKPGGVWSQEGSVWNVASNTTASASPGPARAYVALPGILDGLLDVVIDGRLSTRAGVVLRDDGSNGVVVLYRPSRPPNLQPELQLYVRQSARPLAVPVAKSSVPATDVGDLRVSIVGSRIDVFWNGLVALSYAMDPAQLVAVSDVGSTRWGLWVEEGESPHYSHFWVEGVVRT